jgi:hypothetical protein
VSETCPWTFRFGVGAAACAASQATSPHLAACASFATAVIARRSRVSSIGRTCWGGTDIFHMPPGRVKLTAGTDSLRCLRLSNKVLRWYSECCRTPIANTPRSAGLPGHWHDSLLHGPRGAQSFSGRGAWSAALPHLRTLCRRASPAERTRSAVAWDFRPPRIKVARLVDARARSAHAVLRRSNEGSARRAARAHR